MNSTRDVIVRTDRFEDAVAFYRDAFGLTPEQLHEKMIGFETGGFVLYVEPGEPHGPVFEFEVDDVQAAKRALLARGCTLVEENPAIPRCYVRDPFGMTFNLTPRT